MMAVSAETRKKQSEAYYRNMYKNGHIRCRPVGSEQLKKGYIRVKTAQPNVWKYKQVHIWETENGMSVPAGSVVVFKDGNNRNFAIDNLLMLSRGELAIMNCCKLEYSEHGKMMSKIIKTRYALLKKIGKQKSEEFCSKIRAAKLEYWKQRRNHDKY